MPGPSDRPPRRSDSRVLIVALILPLALVAVALGIVLAWLPQLPQTVASHWGLNGPDGFTARATLPVLLAVLGFGLPLVLGGIVVLTTREFFGFGQKILASSSLAVSVYISALFLGMAGTQRGLADATAAPDLLPTLLLAFAAAAVVGVLAWFALPRWSRPDGGWRHAPALKLAADERAVWLGTARFPVAFLTLVLAPTLAIAAVTSWLAARHGGAAWLLLAIPVAVFLIVLGSTDWRVRVDAAGLRARSILGFPVWTIAVADIAEAGTTTVAAIPEFGGWGVRWAGRGRIGIITRSGPALEVRRLDGRSLVITVDDAESAAELLSARIGARP